MRPSEGYALAPVSARTDPAGKPHSPVRLSHRLVMSYYTAKRLAQVLQLTIQRHEATFGVLETDIQRRVRNM